MEIKGKLVWLCGASSGIGASLAKELARRGAELVLTSRNKEALGSIAEAIQSKGEIAAVYPGDVCKLEEMKGIVAQLRKDERFIDILIVSAGIHDQKALEDFDSAEYESVMKTNFGGMLHCIEAVLSGMLEEEKGVIVGIASLAGYRGLPRAAAYGASKAAIIHFLESARFQLRPKGIKVVVVNPGFVKTPMTAGNDFRMPFLMNPERAAKYICDGLESERDRIVFPRFFAACVAFCRIIPFSLYDLLVQRVWRYVRKG